MIHSARSVVTIGTRTSSRPRSSGNLYIPRSNQRVPKVVRWLLIAFVFTIPFEAAETAFMSGSLSLAKIAGFFFILAYFFHYNPLFSGTRRLPPIPLEMRWFLGYFVMFLLSGIFLPPSYLGAFVFRFITLFQLIVFFWIASSLLQDLQISKTVILTYAIATATLAICTLLQLPGFYGTFAGELDGRVTAMGQNPNAIGELMATALVGLMGLVVTRSFGRFKETTLILLAAPLLVLLAKTGSRAAILSSIIGCSVYLFLFWNSKRKFWTVFLSAVALGGVIYAVAHEPLAAQRLEATYYDQSVAGRDTLFSAAIKMFLEQPFVGWHPILIWQELGARVGEWERDAHNIFLHLLLEVGLVGAIPFFIGLILCLRAAWKASSCALGLVFLALLITTLLINSANTGLTTKPFWLMLGLAVGAAGNLSKQTQVRAFHPVDSPFMKTRPQRPIVFGL